MDRRVIMGAALGVVLVGAGGAYWWMNQQDSAPPAPPMPLHKPMATAASGMAASGMAGSGTAMAASGQAGMPAMSGSAATMAATGSSGASGTLAKPAPESDAVALSEEDLDKLKQEHNDLDSRAQDLESQVKDGKTLLAMKEKQIKELEAQLKAAHKAAAK